MRAERAIPAAIAVATVALVAGVALWLGSQAVAWAALAAVALLAVQLPLPGVIIGLVTVRCLADSIPLVTALGLQHLDLNVMLAVALIGFVAVRATARPGRVPWMTLAPIVVGLTLSWGWGRFHLGDHPSMAREYVRELSLVASLVLPMTLSVRRARSVVRLIPLTVFVPALVAVVQSLSGQGRATSTFPHPNAAALAFGVAGLVAVAQIADRATRSARDLWLVALVGGALLSTGSMAGVGAFTLAVIALLARPLVGDARSSAGWRRRRRLVGPLAVAGCLILLFSLSPMGGERLEELSSTRSPGSVSGIATTTNSLDWRFYNWFELIRAWRDSPFLGHGLGSTIEVVQPGRNLPHNEYVRYLVEIGVVGTLVALLALLRGLRWLNHQRWRASAPAHMVAANLAWALMVFLLVQSLAANTLLYTSSIYVGLTAIGALIVLSRDRAEDIEVAAHHERPRPIPLRALSSG